MDNKDATALNISSFNCRGMRNQIKRKNVFEWLRCSYNGVVLLQETHSCITDEIKWAQEWKGEIIFSHGEYNARGVAILIPDYLTKDITILEQKIDDYGRYIFLKCKIFNTELLLINLYCPTKDKIKAQEDFYVDISKIIEEYGEQKLLIGGDLNTYLDVKKDKKGGKQESQSKFSENINNLMNEYDLADIWRIRNPDKKTYTRRENSKIGLVQSRLDYWLASISLTYHIQETYIKPGNSSDHSIIGIKIVFNENSKRGKGFWKFNNDLLTDKKYVELVKEIIKNTVENVDMEDKNMFWEFLKCEIRSKTILYAGQRARENAKIEKKLKDQVEKLEKNLQDSNYLEYLELKGEWEGLHLKKNHGILLRAKALWTEEGEKNTKYFLNLEKRNYNTKNITTLISNEGKEITELEETIKEEKKYYKNLYSSKLNQNDISEDFLKNLQKDIPKLNDIEKNLCDEILTIEECGKALKLLPNNKSPGSDGYTTNFYKFFWPDIKILLFNSFIYSFAKGSLTQNQKLGILNLLPKKDKDLRYLANWRPVSLLNTDYKILTKVFAIRLQKVIPSIINHDQVGYLKGRYIGQNIRIIFDLLKYSDLNDIEAFLVQVDFEKAFDSIEWPFLFKCLESFNFGENFNQWVKIFYNNISSCVGNNGHYSNYFKLSRSIRQGCPISALLFILVAEMLAIKIRREETIEGISINETEFKLSMMADDTTLILKNIDSLDKAINIFEQFRKCSGLKLNLNKTEIIPIGKSKRIQINLPNHLSKIKIKHGPFKALGVWFASTQSEITSLNLDDRIKNMETTINIWKGRCLSLKGKITIIKTIVVPQIQFLFSMISIEDITIKRIEKILYSFIWPNNVHKIKKNTIISPIELGGLGMIDIKSCNLTAKGSWIRRLLGHENSKWKVLTWHMLNINTQQLSNSNCLDKNKQGKSSFHTQILLAWSEINSFEPITLKEIINQSITENKYIRIDNKPISYDFLGIINMTKLRKMKLKDIIDNNWKLITKHSLEQKLQNRISILRYMSIIKAIPISWKEKIKKVNDNLDIHTLVITEEPHIKIKNKFKILEKVTSKEIYMSLIKKITALPTSINTWVDTYPFLEKIDWKEIFELPYKISTEPYLQSYQYKILNRILNCNDRLYKWKIKTGPECDSCGMTDTIEHRLFECIEAKQIWESIQSWIHRSLDINTKFTVCEVIFGIPYDNDPHIRMMNFIILIAKWYINKNKEQIKRLYFIELLVILKNKIDAIVFMNTLKERENKDWQIILQELLS